MASRKQQAPVVRDSARHGRLRRSSTWRNVGRVALTVALVGIISSASVVAYAVWSLTSDLTTFDLIDQKPKDPAAVGAGAESLDGELNILLIGSDSRQGQSLDDGEEGELNDVNLLLHVAADHQSATVISFPRDLMLPIPSCPSEDGEPYYYSAMSEQQLNSSISYGGINCVVLTIENLTGLDIPYAGLITFDGVIAMSNAIGGVEVCLAQPIVDSNTNLDLPAGNVSLQGEQALQFLRTRYGVGDGGDVSRISNQQVFMSALVRQMKSAETLTNPVKVFGLAKAGVSNMALSSNMQSIGFMQALAATVKDINLDRINFVQYPSFTHPYQAGRLTPDYASGELLIETMLSGQPFQVTGVGEAVAREDAPPVEPQVDPETGEIIEPSGPPAPPEGTVVLPENITGQSASAETCSAGRTKY